MCYVLNLSKVYHLLYYKNWELLNLNLISGFNHKDSRSYQNINEP